VTVFAKNPAVIRESVSNTGEVGKKDSSGVAFWERGTGIQNAPIDFF
jgi:hypothetical protein